MMFECRLMSDVLTAGLLELLKPILPFVVFARRPDYRDRTRI